MPPSLNSSATQVDTSIWLVGGGFLLVGAILAIIGLTWVTKTALFLQRGQLTTGEIVTVEERIGTHAGREDRFRGGTSYKPWVAYTDTSGHRHIIASTRSVASDTFTTGDAVQVCYDPLKPDEMFIVHTRILWLAPGIISALGLFIIFFVGGCLYLMRRNGG